MDAIIISDCHLGSTNCQAQLLSKFLHEVRHEIKPKRLVLNGDVFDSFDSRLRKWHWEVLTDLRKLADEMELVWVCGNHDRSGPAGAVSHLFGAAFCDEYSFDSGGKKVLCVHGDRWDDFIARRPLLTSLADASYRVLQIVDPTFYFAKLAKRSSKTFLRNSQEVADGAIAYMGKRHHDFIVVGHTHNAAVSGGYFNTGSWTEVPCHYATADGGVVELINYGG